MRNFRFKACTLPRHQVEAIWVEQVALVHLWLRALGCWRGIVLTTEASKIIE